MTNKKIQSLWNGVKRASPTVLAITGALGVIGTAILAGRDTLKADRAIKEDSRRRHDGDPYAATPAEMISVAWKCYIPTAAVGGTTILCILSSHFLNRRQQAAIIGAYTLAVKNFNEYKEKLVELYGKKTHEHILEALAVEDTEQPHISGECLFSCCSTDFEDAEEEKRLFYDSWSQRYFQATISQVLNAEMHLNRNFALGGGFAPLSMFYEFLGLETPPAFERNGWWVTDEMYWIDFDHRKAMVDDGLNGEVPCYIIDMMYEPVDSPPD